MPGFQINTPAIVHSPLLGLTIHARSRDLPVLLQSRRELVHGIILAVNPGKSYNVLLSESGVTLYAIPAHSTETFAMGDPVLLGKTEGMKDTLEILSRAPYLISSSSVKIVDIAV